ncbi:MAG TPA: Spy/CpxP family protein refolding chaperone [Stellaceae bacterium]|nr:Spy/CpxP family protein refolding chaperone [Stellaceae bacterium]
MTSHRLSLPAFALLVGLGGLTAAAPAFAQTAAPAPGTATPAPAATPPMHEHHRSAEQFVAGRIAFLKAELKITPQQEAQWSKVAEAMRVNAKAIDAARAQKVEGPQTAVQALEGRSRFAETMAKNTERMLTAFRPLYQNLSPDQQKMADEILAGHFHHHHAFN